MSEYFISCRDKLFLPVRPSRKKKFKLLEIFPRQTHIRVIIAILKYDNSKILSGILSIRKLVAIAAFRRKLTLQTVLKIIRGKKNLNLLHNHIQIMLHVPRGH